MTIFSFSSWKNFWLNSSNCNEHRNVEEEEEEDRIGRNYATMSTSDALAQCILMSGINEADAGAQPLRRSDGSAQRLPCEADELCNFARIASAAAAGVTT